MEMGSDMVGTVCRIIVVPAQEVPARARSVRAMATVSVRGCELAYDEVGSGDRLPFVWGHGLTSSRADEARLPLLDLDRVGDDRLVVRFDARGHGESGDIADPADGDWAALALDEIGLIDRLGIDRLVLGGASMGAATALHAALGLGDRVDALVLLIPPTGWETRRAQVELYEQMASIVDTAGIEPLLAGLRATPPPDPFVGDDGWTKRRAATLHAADPSRLAAALRGAGCADLPDRDRIASISAPTLVLAWTGDPGHPTSTAHELGALLADCHVTIASSAADLGGWTDLVVAFLADH